MRQLDFICVGPSRTGTTALFKALRQHPQVYIPPDKECPIGETPLDLYMRRHFDGQADGKVIGTISPHYGKHPGYATIIRSLWPQAKIIILLRNPVERAWSHWLNFHRLGKDGASFDEAIRRPGNVYKFHSLYGQNLLPYCEYFDTLFVFSQNLRERPGETMDEVHRFLGLQPFTARNLDVDYNGSRKFPMQRIPLVYLIPPTWRSKVWWLIGHRFRKPDMPDLSLYMDQDFRDDKELLEDVIGKEMPW